jgi:hypothetical protein
VTAILGRIALDYDRTRARPNSWMENDTFDGVLVRFSEALSKEWSGELFVKYRRHRPDALFVRPIDADLTTWSSESVVVHADFARVSFVFGGTPEKIARLLFCQA